MPPKPRLCILALSLSLTLSLASETCWYPDQVTQTTDIPCNSDGEFSACCSSDSFCLDNGLCLSGGLVSRGSCTDKSWKSSECAQYCTGDSYDDAGVALQPCNDAANTWTCGTSNSNCINNQNTFVINSGNDIVLRASQVAALQPGSSSVLAISPSTVLTVEGAAAAGNNKTASGTFSAGQVAGVGVGVGVPLLLALLAAIFVILRQRKRLQRLETAAQSSARQPSRMSQTTYVPSPAGLPAYEGYPAHAKQAGGYYQGGLGQGQGQAREMDATQISEVEDATSRSELPTSPK